MTTQEHILILNTFFVQQRAIRVLLDMLTSRGVLSGDDEAAFQSAQQQNAPRNLAIYEETFHKYLSLAKVLGVETGLEQLPPPDETWFERPP